MQLFLHLQNQEDIQHEKEIFKMSGTMNTLIVHNATGGIISMRKQIKQLKLNYKVNLNRDFNEKKCNKCWPE